MTNANKLLIFSLIFKLRFCDIFFINLPKITATCVYHMSLLWGTILYSADVRNVSLKKNLDQKQNNERKKEFIVLLNIRNNMIYFTII